MTKQVPLFKVFMADEVDRAILETLHSGYIAEGAKVKEFGRQIAAYIGNPYVVPVSSCTMALLMSYRLADIGLGDEVITTPLTCIATNTPLLQLGAKIVWADCEPRTGMIDPKKLEELISKKTKAIVVLHKDGDLAKMNEILAIAKKYNVKVVEDAAHTFGAQYQGRKVGTIGDYTCFSFQAIKHVTTGDGGVLACKDEADYKFARKLKWLGVDKEEPHEHENIWMDDVSVLGYKGNMNDIAATIGLANLRHADEIIAKYHENGQHYTELLQEVDGVELVEREKGNYETYWTYVILSEHRDRIMAALKEEGIASMVVHPRNDAYSLFKESKRDLPGVDYYAARELSLPCGWWVERKDIERIVEIVAQNA